MDERSSKVGPGDASNSSGARDFTGQPHFLRQTRAFTGMVAPRVGTVTVGSVFPRVQAWIWESCRQKAHETAARARFTLQILKIQSKNTEVRGTLWKRRSKNIFE